MHSVAVRQKHKPKSMLGQPLTRQSTRSRVQARTCTVLTWLTWSKTLCTEELDVVRLFKTYGRERSLCALREACNLCCHQTNVHSLLMGQLSEHMC